jgi:hypothetical protein
MIGLSSSLPDVVPMSPLFLEPILYYESKVGYLGVEVAAFT